MSNVGKGVERIVFKQVYNSLLENELLYKYQSGCIPGHSTTLQLIGIYHHFCQAFDRNQFSCMVFLYISKASDRVWHTGLLRKLEQYGILGDLLIWFTDYLSNRTQIVVFNYVTSKGRSTTAGVPQDLYLVIFYFYYT